MSYQVLARKYRPKGFDTLVGQEHVVRALSHALDSGRLHHAYLFTGTRGVGKTTLSRILAKAFNCQGTDGNGGVTSQPCGRCDACVAIDGGRFVDYIEIDAASNRGVDEMAQLLEQAVYAPSNARFKVYMIDEVHMLTNHAFNAMLKTLEEPPAHVKFILATTDPQKIPVTVLSRCLQFNLKQMPPAHIIAHLTDILGQEGIAFETPALRLLAQGAQGSMRDALSLTDQAIAYAAGNVTLEAVQGMLGALDQSFLISILDALAANDGAGLIAVADDMAARSLSYGTALQDIGSLLHRIALAQMVPTAIADELPERADLMRLAKLFQPEEIQLFYQIAVHGRNELGLAPDDFAGFSMTLLRMLAFRPETGSGGDVGGSERTKTTPSRVATDTPSRVTMPSTLPSSSVLAPLPVSVSIPVPAQQNNTALSPARAALEAARSNVKPRGATSAAPVSRDTKIAAKITPSPQAVPPWDDVVPQAPAACADDRHLDYGGTVVMEAPSLTVAPQLTASFTTSVSPSKPVAAPSAIASVPVPALDWDGDWPSLAHSLSVRGVVQQLAQQSELLACEQEGAVTILRLQVTIETLRASATVEKLAAALTAHFSKPVRLDVRLGAVQHTAAAAQLAQRAEQQRQAEHTMQSDPFVQAMKREFGATIVPGSIKPISPN
ncbi:MAG: DNA polymerase III subunit gamma/tau [Pseudomonadota bacterium]